MFNTKALNNTRSVSCAVTMSQSSTEDDELAALGIHSDLSGGAKSGKRRRREQVASSVHVSTEEDLEPLKNVIYWIRQDLRLHDNPALCLAAAAARKSGGRVHCVYIHSPGAFSVYHFCKCSLCLAPSDLASNIYRCEDLFSTVLNM